MRTDIEIFDIDLYDKFIDDVDTCKVQCTPYAGRKYNEFLATGDMFICFKDGDECHWETHSGEFYEDSFNEYGFKLIPEK